MELRDYRGDAITGATASALERFESALASFQSWRGDPARTLAAVLDAAPTFVMAYVFHAYVLICTREPARVRTAGPIYTAAAGIPCNRRERLHLAAIAAALRDDYEGAKSILGQLLEKYPRDALALQVAHAFDYLTGDLAGLRGRVAGVLPAWSPSLPGYHAVLAMQAFSLVECGEPQRAQTMALAALELEPLDARACHALAHVFEATKRPAEGLRWMSDHITGWDGDTAVATHCWWHNALFHLQRGDTASALSLYDHRIRARRPASLADLIDASALLWRVLLRHGEADGRWIDLSTDWAPRLDEGFCTFSDLHAMLTFVGAQRWDLAARMLHALEERQHLRTRHGETTRLLGLPACHAFLAFGRGDFRRTIDLLTRIPTIAHLLGGSHAQRDILQLTLRTAVERSREPAPLIRLAA